MPPSKFEANLALRRGVKRVFFVYISVFVLECVFPAYAIIDFLADRLVFLNTVTYDVMYLAISK